jgi:rare lipoprotein A
MSFLMNRSNIQPALRIKASSLGCLALLALGLAACSTPMPPAAVNVPATPPVASKAPPSSTPPSQPNQPQPAPQSPAEQPSEQAAQPTQAKPPAAPIDGLLKLKPAANKPYTALGTRYEPLSADRMYEASGWASWYGAVHHGLPTASGEIYDMNAFTAAHTVLPIPSYARVTNLTNGTQAVVRINDRGPFKEKRVMDVSRAAAKHLGFVGQGLAKVSVRLMSTSEAQAWLSAGAVQPGGKQSSTMKAAPVANSKTVESISAVSQGYYAQFAAYKDNAAALVLAQRADQAARDLGLISPLKPQEPLVQLMGTEAGAGERLSRVLAGPFSKRAEAEKAGATLAASLKTPFILYQQK